MTLPVKTQAQFVADMTATWASLINIAPSFAPGDPMLALLESLSAQCVFLQGLSQQILNISRAQTSTGSDLDSWMTQFNFFRQPSTASVGAITFSKNSAAATAIAIPAATLLNGVYTGGSLVQTSGGAIVYQVIPDTAQATYDVPSNTYILQVGQTSMTSTVQAINPGSGSNVSANALSQIGSSIAGIDNVSNGLLINSGIDAQSDASFLAAFPPYLATLAKATQAAVIQAASSVQQGIQVATSENKNPNGNTQLGAFTVYVDNGTGTPPASLLSAVYAAVNSVRAFSVQAYVSAPALLSVSVSLSVRVISTATVGVVQIAVQSAIVAYINALPEGSTLYISAITNIALSVPGVVSVQPNVVLNNSPFDMSSSVSQALRTTGGSVTVGVY